MLHVEVCCILDLYFWLNLILHEVPVIFFYLPIVFRSLAGIILFQLLADVVELSEGVAF